MKEKIGRGSFGIADTLKIFLALCVLPSLVGLLMFIALNQPKLSCNAQQFGLVLLRGGYRSWFLSFSDGESFEGRSMVVRRDGKMVYGYRLWPKFSHVDMRQLMQPR